METRLSPDHRENVKYTSVTINQDFASKTHRDTGNAGLSIATCVGDFTTGGELLYWSEDDGCEALESLTLDQAMIMDTSMAMATSMARL